MLAGFGRRVEVSLYQRKYFLLSEAAQVIARRLAAADRQSYVDAGAAIDDAKLQLLEALFEGAIRAEGVMSNSSRSPEYIPPRIECDEWTPIAQGLWSHTRCAKQDNSLYYLDEIGVYWNDDCIDDYYNKRTGEIVGDVYKRIRILGAEIDREFPAPETTTSADAPLTSPGRTGVAGRPSSKYLAEQEMQRRAKRGIICSGVAAEMRELCVWLKREHPQAPPLQPKSLENSLREEYRKLRRSVTPSQ